MPSSSYWSPDSEVKSLQSSHRERVWTNTPGYSSTDRRFLPTNSYSDYQGRMIQSDYGGDYTVTDGVPYYHTPPGPRNLNGTLWTSLTEALATYQGQTRPSDAVMQNRLLVKALAKTADAKTNLAVTLAEASKTSNLILGRANRVYRAWRSFRRGDLQGVARSLAINPRQVHKTWLEYQYGWMPLLMDVKNSAEFFAQQQVGKPLKFSVSEVEKLSFTKPLTDVGPYGSGGYPWPDPRKYESLSYTTRYRLKLVVEVTNPHLAALQQLGLTNPALVAWELTPFSFVFDWFCQVGDWLQGLTALHGLTVRDAFFSKATSGTATRSFSGGSNTVSGVTYVVSSDSYGVSSYRGYSRVPISVSSTLTYPPVDPKLGFKRLTSGLALLRAISRR